MRTIEKSIKINAPKEKVWEVLVNSDLNQTWYAVFSEGTFAETDWKIGSKVIFADKSGSGLVGKITENEFCKVLSIEYTGTLEQGREDTESDSAIEFKGAHEKYVLAEQENFTTLEIASDMNEEYFDSMFDMWDKALLKIKELAE